MVGGKSLRRIENKYRDAVVIDANAGMQRNQPPPRQVCSEKNGFRAFPYERETLQGVVTIMAVVSV
jgi:hypothetical protein